MKSIINIVLLCLTCSLAHAECVILLHGLARTQGSMEKIAEHLRKENYQVVNLGYPSRHHAIEKLADMAIKPALKECQEHSKINFVTHSLGGILVRQYLSRYEINDLHRVVMLGPPNQGSEVVDKMADVPGFHLINGDAGLQLGTQENSVPITLGPAEFDLGVVAGTSSINLILSLIIPGQDDGKVSVERTKLDGMNDHVVMDVTHSFMMRNKHVIQQTLHYLKHGHFVKTNDN